MIKNHYWDIESLDNVFTVAIFKDIENEVSIYYLIDNEHQLLHDTFIQQAKTHIYEKNKNFNGTIQFYNLKQKSVCHQLSSYMGLSDAYCVNHKNAISRYPDEFRLVCDTDENYDNTKHPYIWGYNSNQYDTTMMTLFLYETWHIRTINGQDQITFTPPTAYQMRQHNNNLFTEQFKNNMPTYLTCESTKYGFTPSNYSDPRWTIRKNMLLSGRHLDVANLNEKQSKVALKRLLGLLGYQILESDKLDTNSSYINTTDELIDLIAYNVSDVINLKELNNHPFYKSQFQLKKGLLDTYKELVYERKNKDEYVPDVRPERVRKDRLFIDSRSAQFATKTLCPYEHLSDLKTVSFNYPHEDKVKELQAQGINIKQVNVLDECKAFVEENFKQHPHVIKHFDNIYRYYKSIEGKNFNTSEYYRKDYALANGELEHPPQTIASIEKTENTMFYYYKDGTPSSCFVTFSIGGIHGAEMHMEKFKQDVRKFETDIKHLEEVKQRYNDPLDLRNAKTITLSDGNTYSYSDFLASGMTIKKMKEMTLEQRQASCYKDFEKKRPQIFIKETDGTTKLNPKYAYTSAVLTNHNDFTSYYPNLLRMLLAFYNKGLGYDRYGEIFDNKERFGKLMKDETLPEEERTFYSNQREGTKLLLNSASGAGDTNFKSPIQMNNRIISMRIIGQLFTWRIGQAQTLAGGKVPSTNTDGLYSVMSETLNQQVLNKESAIINVAIEPESMFLISKDANNRLEVDPKTGNVLSASGGSLSCRKDTNPTKALTHPAIVDWALAEYLIIAGAGYKGLSLDKPFNEEIGRSILAHAETEFDTVHRLRMFQNVLASSKGSVNYIFGIDNNEKPVILQHYNRMFIMKDNTPNTLHIKSASARIITDATIKKRQRNNESMRQHDNMALFVLEQNGVPAKSIPTNKEAIIKKVTSVDESWSMRIENRSLFELNEEEANEIFQNLDMEKYLNLVKQSYENNWQNTQIEQE